MLWGNIKIICFLLLTFTFLLFTYPIQASHEAECKAGNYTYHEYCEGHNMWVNSGPPDCGHDIKGSCLSEEKCINVDTDNVACVPLSQVLPSPSASSTVNVGAPPAGLPDIENVFKKVVSVSVSLAFVALVFVLIWAGIRYLTSGGDPKAIQAAALTITWAGLGVLFLVFAWLILLLIQTFTGVNVTVFDLKHFCEGSRIPGCRP